MRWTRQKLNPSFEQIIFQNFSLFLLFLVSTRSEIISDYLSNDWFSCVSTIFFQANFAAIARCRKKVSEKFLKHLKFYLQRNYVKKYFLRNSAFNEGLFKWYFSMHTYAYEICWLLCRSVDPTIKSMSA
jgi:hypothetical protein